MNITKDDSGIIVVAFPYDPPLVTKVKTIPGHRWHPAEKYWSFPDKDGVVEKILKVFKGEEIQIDPALQTDLHHLSTSYDPTSLKSSPLSPTLVKGGEGGFSDKNISPTDEHNFESLELLGHKSSKTTEIYTHVSTKDFAKIKNPLDQILEGKGGG